MVRRVLQAVLYLSLFLAGCGGEAAQGGGTPVVPPPVANYTLSPNVRVLPDGAVAAVTDTTVTLATGAGVPRVGDILISNAGPFQFVRRVVAVDGSVITTNGEVSLVEIFETANIEEVNAIPPEALARLQPAAPGITFGPPESIQIPADALLQISPQLAGRAVHARPGDTITLVSVPINFDNVTVNDGLGNVRCKVTGKANVFLGLEAMLDISGFPPSYRGFRLVPIAALAGEVNVVGSATGSFSKQLPINVTGDVPLPPIGGLVPLEGNLSLILEVNGRFDAGGEMKFSGGVSAKFGVGHDPGRGFFTVGDIQKFFTVTPPVVLASAEVGVTMIKPELTIGLADGIPGIAIGLFVRADVLR
ncbi:MAG: hypothetical protein AB1758_29055, partial [Candidatus Eremiobacterota bacterium]